MANKKIDEKEYNNLLIKYNRLEKRLNKIVKMSDTQQKQLMDLNDELEYALDKIKNHNYITLPNGYYWNKDTRNLLKNDKIIKLTNYEVLFLECLINNINHTVFYEDIHNYIYSIEKFSQSALATMVSRIRQKTYKDIIKISYKEGYKIGI